MHGPQSYSEKTSLLRDQRSRGASSVRSDNHRTHAAKWSSRPRPMSGVSPEQAVVGCFGIGALYFFIVVVLVSLGLFLHAEFAQTLPPYVRKVAIIGAGPAGSSAAYNIQKFAHQKGILVDITVYEKNDFVGGRTTCIVNVDGEGTVQIAAKGFHASDKILVDTVNQLGLTPVMLDGRQDTDLSGRSGDRWGVFDGSKIVFRQSHPTNFLTGWWWSFKLFYFYGYSPKNTRTAVTNTISKLKRIYSPRFFPFMSLTSVLQDLELTEETSITGSQLLDKYKVGTPFQRDLINAWTRRDFGQNLGQISGLAAMTSPDDGGDMTIDGGHWTLFEEMITASKAELNLNTTAFGARKMDWGGWVLASQPAGKGNDPQYGDYQEFDSVILAAPFQSSNIEIKGGQLAYVPDEIEYSPIHVTLFKSPRRLSRGYFRHNDEVPETMLTTLGSDEYDGLFKTTGVDGVGRVGFYSITSVKRLARLDASGVIVEEFLYKIVSPGMINDGQIYDLLGASPGDNGVLPWTYRHEWPSAYPYIYPRTTFAELKLDNNLWYTGGIEEVSSSMELSSLMGANVAKLVVDEWAHEARGKRPDRKFDEVADGVETLYPETIESYLKMQYQGIWNEKLASHQEGGNSEGESEEKSEKLEEKSEEKQE